MKFKDDDGTGSDRGPDMSSWERSSEEPLSSDSSSIATRSEFEFPLEKAYPPCQVWIYPEGRYCLSTERSIIHLSSNSGKKIVCGNDHNHEHKGGAFIPAWEFGPGGEFEGVVPVEFLPPEAKITATRWKVSKARESVLRNFRECAHCGAPPYQGGSDKVRAWQWIQENDPEFLAEIQTELQKVQGFEFQRWFEALSQPMRAKVVKRLDMSTLTNDHSISRKIANGLWLDLSIDKRQLLQDGLVFKLCRHCNLGKAAKLISREAIVAMYTTINYGSVAAARADERRWQLLEGLLTKVYGAKRIA